MTKHIILLFVLSFLFLSGQSHSQSGYEIEGKYKVGKTSCTIQWSTGDKVFKVYWKKGIGHTILFYRETQPNGNLVYDEFETDQTTQTGTFYFKDDSYGEGVYVRDDEKKFDIIKQ